MVKSLQCVDAEQNSSTLHAENIRLMLPTAAFRITSARLAGCTPLVAEW